MDDSDGSDEEYENARRPREFRERVNMNIFRNNTFREAFRVDIDVVEYILMIIGPHIQHETERNHALSPREQLLTALHWYGNGSQYHTMIYCHGISEPTVCRVVHRVSSAICTHLLARFVKWPNDTTNIPIQFQRISNFPGMYGHIIEINSIVFAWIKIDSIKKTETPFLSQKILPDLLMVLKSKLMHLVESMSQRLLIDTMNIQSILPLFVDHNFNFFMQRLSLREVYTMPVHSVSLRCGDHGRTIIGAHLEMLLYLATQPTLQRIGF